jgi:hypothetical protein
MDLAGNCEATGVVVRCDFSQGAQSGVAISIWHGPERGAFS